jgi:hypothetical protein
VDQKFARRAMLHVRPSLLRICARPRVLIGAGATDDGCGVDVEAAAPLS